MNRPISSLVAVMLVGVVLSDAGERSNIRGLGMARSVTAPSRGLSALGVNPANLGMGGESFLSMDLLPFGLRVSSELISYDIYRDYFTGVANQDGTRSPRYLTEEDKNRILDAFPGGLADTQIDFELMPVGFCFYDPSVGGIGLAVTERMGSRLVLPKEYAAFLLRGLDSSGSRYDFSETDLSAWWWREYNLSYGVRIPAHLDDIGVYAGVGIKYISGFGVMETDHYTARVANERENGNQFHAHLFFDYLIRRSGVDAADPDRVGARYSLFPRPAGTGFGFDLGLAGRLRGMDIHLSLTDIGSVTWRQNLVETFGSYNLEIRDPFHEAAEDTIQNSVRGTNRPGMQFSTSLPTKIRIGVSIGADSVNRPEWMPPRLLLVADLVHGLNESMGNSTNLRASVGAEYRGLSWLPVRTGLSIGDDSRLRWAFGFGIDVRHFSFDMATENLGLLFSLQNFDLYSFAMGFRFRF